MNRELPQWTVFEICQVTLGNGVVGFGETMVFYTWGRVSDDSVKRVIGKSAAEFMWEPGLPKSFTL